MKRMGTALALLIATSGCAAPSAVTEPADQYLVFYTGGARDDAADAVKAAGGVVDGSDDRLGYLLVRAAAVEPLAAIPSIAGVTANRRIGGARALTAVDRASSPMEAAGHAAPASSAAQTAVAGKRRPDPLASRQWDMKLIGATASGSYAKRIGSHKVLVGIIDTGVDGKHPDIAPNFNRELSRNFVTDRPKDPNGKTFDGKCEFKGCKDPADHDDEGHGTHVASTIGSPLNGIGVAGVAPGVSLVNLRAGTDSGYFFLKPTMDALTYAADVGVDVVNMSFFVDPWTFNCTDNPADTAAQQLQQRGVIEGMNRAVAYARARGVTLITAIGNSGTDLGNPSKDGDSPNYPLRGEHDRTIDNSCLNVPAELDGVISVTSVGPSGRKASYSDYGLEQADVAAPGGDTGDSGTKVKGVRREILAAAPKNALKAQDQLQPNGKPWDGSVVRECGSGTCAYYQYLEGTSMASPHVAGVAALLVARYGKPGRGGLHLAPATVERLLYSTARDKACPAVRAVKYRSGVQTCEGTKAKNGFYGRGIVSALRAVR